MNKVKVLEIVHAIAQNFAMDTREIAEEYFDGDLKKALKVLNSIPGICSDDVNDEHARGVRHNGKLACLVWQLPDDSQHFSEQDTAEYLKSCGVDPEQEF